MRLLLLITYLTESVILSSLFKLLKYRGQINSIFASFSFKVFRKEFIILPVNSFPVIRLKMFFLSIFVGHSISPSDQFFCCFNYIFRLSPWLFRSICKFLLIWRSIPHVKNYLNILLFININQLVMGQFYCNRNIVEKLCICRSC